MKKATIITYLGATLAVTLCLAVVADTARASQEHPSKNAKEQEPMHLIPSLDGGELFRSYCATCHGVTGKGDGPVAAALEAKLSDLTTIARRNGGTFPTRRVRTIIAGDDLIIAHGTREMPIWGPIFHQVEWDRDFGNVRLDNVTKYVESIQEKKK
jgi:hypothetical protein